MKLRSIRHFGGVVVGVDVVDVDVVVPVVVVVVPPPGPVGFVDVGLVEIELVDLLEVELLLVPDVVEPVVVENDIGTAAPFGLHICSVGSISRHVLHGFSHSPSDPFILHILNRSCNIPFLYQ